MYEGSPASSAYGGTSSDPKKTMATKFEKKKKNYERRHLKPCDHFLNISVGMTDDEC